MVGASRGKGAGPPSTFPPSLPSTPLPDTWSSGHAFCSLQVSGFESRRAHAPLDRLWVVAFS